MAHVNTAVADDQDDWRLIKNTPQDRLEVNAHSTPQWNYTPEGVLASSPQVGLGGAGLGLRSSEPYLKCICSKKGEETKPQLPPAALLRLPLSSLWLPAFCPLASMNSAATSPRLPFLSAASPAAQGR
mgnify:CR=1 FL=1